jgi:hypothetical protein
MIDRLQLLIHTLIALFTLIGITTFIFYLTKPPKRKFIEDKGNE